jgi:hypothetical protein
MPRGEHLKPHQYKKGQSGNEKGRPKGSGGGPFLSTVLKQALQEDDLLDGKEVKVEYTVVASLLKEAKAGNVQAINIVFDRVDGKPLQAIEIEDKTERPLDAELLRKYGLDYTEDEVEEDEVEEDEVEEDEAEG